jgi:hypothetical protein
MVTSGLELMDTTESIIADLDWKIDQELFFNKDLDDEYLSMLLKTREGLQADLLNGYNYSEVI